MRRAAIDINIFLVVKYILVHLGAGAVSGEYRSGERRVCKCAEREEQYRGHYGGQC